MNRLIKLCNFGDSGEIPYKDSRTRNRTQHRALFIRRRERKKKNDLMTIFYQLHYLRFILRTEGHESYLYKKIFIP